MFVVDGRWAVVVAGCVVTGRHKMGTPRTLTYSKLMKEISPQVVSGHAKVTVVGCGQVGMAAAFSMLTLGVCSDLALVDMRRDAAIGEKMDLLHGLAFLGRRVWVEADSDYAISKVQSKVAWSFITDRASGEGSAIGRVS